MKNLIRTCIFLMIFCMLFSVTQKFVSAKWGPGTQGAMETMNMQGFYDEPKNSLEVMLLGASNVFYGTSPVKMYEAYGFTSYVRGSANQPLMMTYYALMDSLRTQSPKVVVLEMGEMMAKFDPVATEYSARRALDYMKLSPVKLKAIRDLPIDGSEQTRTSYLFPLLRYHSRWKEINKTDFDYFGWERHNYMKGQYFGGSRLDFTWPEGYMTPSDKVETLPEQNVDYATRIAALCREKGIELVLINTPTGTWNYARHNAIAKIAQDLNVPYLDYNMPELIEATGIIDTEDFHYNQWHLRVTGADKLSVHLGQYLVDHYGLTDQRGNSKYSAWDEDVRRYNQEKEKAGLPL